MQDYDRVALIALGAISLATFLTFGWDKLQAKRRARRIPEATLVLLGAIGGWFGGLAGMLVFRHKTSKPSFIFKYALGIVVFAGTAYCYLRFTGRLS